MDRLIGIETEYGIVVEGMSAGDWIHESRELVQCCDAPWVSGWNYRGEDPRRDMRGFTVHNLSTNPDDAQFDAGKGPFMSREEERSDRVLSNGARFYNDHGHPEYATPECRTLMDIIAHDKAGERIVLAAAAQRTQKTGKLVTLYKNNTDFHGASYGAHECYLMRRDVPTDTLIQLLLPFFVTRCLYAGAGKSGAENTGQAQSDVFQLSQRADFFAVDASVDTLHNRPIVNTRDEPHATPRHYRRLHVICGDANMSEYAGALKIGTTSLVLTALEMGMKIPIHLADPVAAARIVSRDISLNQTLKTSDGKHVSALDIQRLYLHEVCKLVEGRDEETNWILTEWGQVLEKLETSVDSLSDELDWVAKYNLLNPFREENGLSWNDPHIMSLDLAYHNIDPESGLYYGMEQAGRMRRIVTEARIQAAMRCAPANTRAYLRGIFVQRFGSHVKSVGWNGVAFRHQEEDMLFDMNSLVEENVVLLNEEFASARTLNDVLLIMASDTQSEGEQTND